MKSLNDKTELPKDIQDRFVKVAVAFKRKTGADTKDIQLFIVSILRIYDEYMNRKEPVH